MKEAADPQDPRSFQQRRPSAVDHDVQVVMSETAGKATRGRGEDGWRLEPQGETETLETRVGP